MTDDRLKRHDLTGGEWARLEPLLPAQPRQGHRWNDHRVVINGVSHRTRTGCPWRDLPAEYGNWKTVYNRHRRWSGDGRWEMILDAPRAGCDGAEGAARAVAADATVVRAHQHAAGARHAPPKDIPAERLAVAQLSAPSRTGAAPNDKNPPAAGANPGKPKDREALGRPGGGLSTKVHLPAQTSTARPPAASSWPASRR